MRKIVLISSCLIFLFALGFLIIKIKNKVERKELTSEVIRTLKNFKVTTLNDSEVYIHELVGNDREVVIVLFNSDCDHCLRELDEFKKHRAEFHNVKTIFLSVESTEKLRTIKNEKQIADFITVAKISSEELFANFGVVQWPSIFRYNSQRELVRNFIGETDIKFILQIIVLPWQP